MRRRFLSVLWTAFLILSGHTLYAQECPAGTHAEFCDTGWRGMSKLAERLESIGSVTFLDTVTPDALLKASENSAFVMISPPDIHFGYIDRAVKNGARMLIFDESSVSAVWFEQRHGITAVPDANPFISDAPRINGRRELPVITQPPDAPFYRGLADSRLQTAFNHPTPLRLHDGRHVFIFSIPARLLTAPDAGGAVIIRDESLAINFMGDKLDNAALIEDIATFLCKNRTSCSINIVKPNFKQDALILPPPPDTLSARLEAEITSLKQDIRQFAETHRRQIDAIPWRIVIFGVIAAWCLLIIIAIIPLRRVKF